MSVLPIVVLKSCKLDNEDFFSVFFLEWKGESVLHPPVLANQ